MSLFGDCLERWSPPCRSCDDDQAGDNHGDEDDVRC